ncbi:MAG: zinc ABC transporter substrate-binding protein [Bermanella sp.]
MKSIYLMVCLLLVGVSGQLQALSILACEPEWKALALELVGEDSSVYSATTAFQDPHHIQARPSLLSRARRADLLICTGAELEAGWLPLLMRKSANKRIQVGAKGHFLAAQHVELQDVSGAFDRQNGDVHGGGDPHFFLDPNYIVVIAKALMERLILLDPVNEGEYIARHNEFSIRLSSAIKRWEVEGASLKGASFVVHHNNWQYLTRWLGIKTLATLEPKPGLPSTSRHLSKVLQSIKGEAVWGVLLGSYQDDKAASWLRDKAGLRVVKLPYTVGGNAKANDLFALFDQTIALLKGYSGAKNAR